MLKVQVVMDHKFKHVQYHHVHESQILIKLELYLNLKKSYWNLKKTVKNSSLNKCKVKNQVSTKMSTK